MRTADMGRIIGGSLVNTTLIQQIRADAIKNNYRSLAYLRQGGPSKDDEKSTASTKQQFEAQTKFYHKIWEHELGNHAVAQGGAQLEESHMMIPYLVRATSDSEHVVPTLCAFDDFIGATDAYTRIEQTALMEIENFALSRPSVKYSKGGRGRVVRDIGTYIRSNGDMVEPLSILDIIFAVDTKHMEKAATCCAMLMTAVHDNAFFTDQVRRGGLARQTASETRVRELAARIANLPATIEL